MINISSIKTLYSSFESIEKHIEISRVVLLHRIEREEGRGATFKPNEDEDVNGRTDSSRD